MWYGRHMTTTDYPVTFTQTKEHRATTKTLASSEPQDKVKMTVDTEGTAHIMSLLTDLYSDPDQAVVREYITNAVDAHADAGQTETPIIVTSPTAWEPSFTVQDFGTGMSLDTIKYIYSSYGRSTKRQDFTQVGAFGLGCKSALTLTSQFSLVSVHNGQSVTAVIARGEDGVGTVSITDIRSTDAPNGTTVSIPIKDRHKFNNALDNFNLSGFPSGSIVVDNKPNVSFKDAENAQQHMDGTVTTTPSTHHWGEVGYYAVMGGVVYPLSYKQVPEFRTLEELQKKRNVYFEIPIASVDLTPSREALRYTDRTRSLLSSLVTKYMETLVANARVKMTACKNLRQAIDTFSSLQTETGLSLGGLAKMKVNVWNGHVIPVSFTVAVPQDAVVRKFEVNDLKTSVLQGGGIGLRETYYLFGENAPVETYRRLFRKYLLNQGQENFDYILVWMKERPKGDPFFSKTVMPESVPLSVVKENAAEWDKKQRALNGGKSASVIKYLVYSYDVTSNRLSSVEMFPSDIPTDAILYPGARGNYGPNKGDILRAVRKFNLTSFPSMIFLPTTRRLESLVNRIGRRPVGFYDYMTFLAEKQLESEFGADWTNKYKERSNLDTSLASTLKTYLSSIEDPEIIRLTSEIAASDNSISVRVEQIFHGLGFNHESAFRHKHPRDVESPILSPYLEKNYPLIGGSFFYRLTSDHIDYINAMYLTRNQRSGTLKSKEG